jgi:hypothetical protein
MASTAIPFPALGSNTDQTRAKARVRPDRVPTGLERRTLKDGELAHA